MIEGLKSFLREQLGLPGWVVLAATGLALHLLANALWKRPVGSAAGLVAPLSAAVLIEAFEIWVRYRPIGLFAPGNDPLWQILGRHSIDVAIMLLPPVVLVTYCAVTAE